MHYKLVTLVFVTTIYEMQEIAANGEEKKLPIGLQIS
jgi:hypothetical protein